MRCFHCKKEIGPDQVFYEVIEGAVLPEGNHARHYDKFMSKVIFHKECFIAVAGKEYEKAFVREDGYVPKTMKDFMK